ncbi:hypothetical protein H0H81_006631 [Sphagnurus paluster]|uniref:RuvB-like helicase n=1 Tax=Sphagnurus paluster TaxID=117069 RepID=A0A9P7K4R2_9AGAR|nr:hypothetical protein H0H81_006631 [Sphagnurus paluster]
MSVMGSLVKNGHTEVTDKLRREVIKIFNGYVDQGVVEVVPGVVFIDTVSSCMIVETIVHLRAIIEGLNLGTSLVDKLTAEGEKKSQRCVLQLLTLVSILVGLAGHTQIEVEDIRETNELFLAAVVEGADFS